jgi:riboflavin synthase
MFTGLVTDIGTVLKAEQRGDLRLEIATSYPLGDIPLGASIACSGVCLTVVDKGEDWFAVDVSAETVSRTAADLWRQGARLNLERALRLGDELGGHLVTGHVDGVAEVVEVRSEGGSTRIVMKLPKELAPFVAEKASITLDGVSLTVNDVTDRRGEGPLMTVNIIPHTAEHSTLGEVAVGRQLNVEIDVLARYLHRMTALKSH